LASDLTVSELFIQKSLLMKNKLILALFVLLGGLVSCKKELDVTNPNQPTPESAATENGILALGQGGVYISGFRGLDGKFNDGVPGYFWSGAVGMHGLLGDEIGRGSCQLVYEPAWLPRSGCA
jgi:hypothetical protein